ncbi:vWA domain-containing protein [Leptolyngbya ohadii]|uniref:vWA domain-containing protein n=1 Tax=Leptolyngbya ohadii TaxID=1962290 RepID=UPI000B59FF93|nr:VWA domain-containing protein [Leptolyngbya ohadii]
MSLETIEFVRNPEPRCPVVLVLDTSASMTGNPINSLNEGVLAFKEEVQKDEKASLRVEVAIITFGESVRVAQNFVTIDQFEPHRLGVSGSTPMGGAIEKAIELVENRKQTYKSNGVSYYRPWVFLITDGEPTDGDRWRVASQHIRQAEADRRLSFFIVGVQGANMEKLSQIASPNTPPLKLDGLKFREFFLWLSSSVQKVSESQPGQDQMIRLAPVSGWAQTTI